MKSWNATKLYICFFKIKEKMSDYFAVSGAKVSDWFSNSEVLLLRYPFLTFHFQKPTICEIFFNLFCIPGRLANKIIFWK